MLNKGLGRLHIPDERDYGYLMESALPLQEPERTWRYWWTSGAWKGDQGSFPHCVGYSWTHLLAVGPIVQRGAPPFDPVWIYKEAQKVDQWEGENYDGTSVRAGAKVLQAAGLLESYLWAFDVPTFVKGLFQKGPIVLGTTWYDGMSYPEKKTNIIRTTGARRGGHAYLAVGGSTKTGMVRIMNSWGLDYGQNGFAWLPMEELEKLLKDHGEACMPVERRLAA